MQFYHNPIQRTYVWHFECLERDSAQWACVPLVYIFVVCFVRTEINAGFSCFVMHFSSIKLSQECLAKGFVRLRATHLKLKRICLIFILHSIIYIVSRMTFISLDFCRSSQVHIQWILSTLCVGLIWVVHNRDSYLKKAIKFCFVILWPVYFLFSG